ncbi:sigma-70 family RNA polymerase sigma factor [Bacillus sp. 2205SS5-2]|uniref:sigma-70 family RNA polymerase sigma factor n=1 Tax=Bacillus sp. 2205SS5-2 TaxID=3109031 RepID=UPI003007DB53
METFTLLQTQYEPMIHKIIQTLHIYKNKDEFYQTGLIALWEANERFDSAKGKFPAFAYSYIKGRMLSDLTKSRKNEDRNVYPEEAFWEVIPGEDSPLLEKEMLQSHCQSLTENQSKWVLYSCLNMFTVKEIAQVENVSLSAVKKWRKGAREKLKEIQLS